MVGGLLFGVGADALFLKLEEELSREKFHDEIISSINEAELEMILIFE